MISNLNPAISFILFPPSEVVDRTGGNPNRNISQWFGMSNEILVASYGWGYAARIGVHRTVTDKAKKPIKKFHC